MRATFSGALLFAAAISLSGPTIAGAQEAEELDYEAEATGVEATGVEGTAVEGTGDEAARQEAIERARLEAERRYREESAGRYHRGAVGDYGRQAVGDEHGDPHGVAGHDAAEHGTRGDAAHGDGAHAAGGAHDAHAMNYTDLAGSFFNFAVWLLALVFLLRKPVAEFLRNRRATVIEGMEEAKRVKEEAEAKYREYSERIENLDAELERLRDEMRRAGMEERERIVAEAARKGDKMREEARFLIDQQMKQLRDDLTREAIEAAVRAAQELLEKGTGAADQERLAQEYLGAIRGTLAQRAVLSGGAGGAGSGKEKIS
jgi:F-type H+-transporting ATPase subunit b